MEGVLEVKTSSGAVAGYVQADVNYWTPQLTSDPNLALVLSFTFPINPISSPARHVEFKMANDKRGTYFGFVVGRDSTSDDIASGSHKYAPLSRVKNNSILLTAVPRKQLSVPWPHL